MVFFLACPPNDWANYIIGLCDTVNNSPFIVLYPISWALIICRKIFFT